jgi:hypothetical protein
MFYFSTITPSVVQTEQIFVTQQILYKKTAETDSIMTELHQRLQASHEEQRFGSFLLLVEEDQLFSKAPSCAPSVFVCREAAVAKEIR